jgi:RNA polymerase sigma-70 factor, ECF subfamily
VGAAEEPPSSSPHTISPAPAWPLTWHIEKRPGFTQNGGELGGDRRRPCGKGSEGRNRLTEGMAVDCDHAPSHHVQSARVRRESYVGTWLPEPIITDTEPESVRHAETADSLSMAFLVLLESLGPVERAVFLLREVFDYRYEEIATIVGRGEDNCRQIAVRARWQIEAKKPRFEASRRKRQELARRFFDAVLAGDTDGLVNMLADDVVAYGDGGGKAPAIRRPVYGQEKVARLFLRARGLDVVTIDPVEVNGQPGPLLPSAEGQPLVVLLLDIADGLIQTVHPISNPDKLRHLAPTNLPTASN